MFTSTEHSKKRFSQNWLQDEDEGELSRLLDENSNSNTTACINDNVRINQIQGKLNFRSNLVGTVKSSFDFI